jgi:L-threonylcarbamoyladenylate synthase
VDIGVKELNMEPTLEETVDWIRSGLIVVAPIEHGYVYLVDAFSHDGVRAMHVLRGDALGVSAQVFVGSIDTAAGIVREISPSISTMMNAFWPGMLSLNLRPQRGLSWDLGDDNELDLFSLRIPSADFVRQLLTLSGPLACASAASAGEPPILRISELANSQNELLRICDLGEVMAGPLTTVVSVIDSDICLLREGAITYEQVSAHVPSITRPNSANT